MGIIRLFREEDRQPCIDMMLECSANSMGLEGPKKELQLEVVRSPRYLNRLNIPNVFVYEDTSQVIGMICAHKLNPIEPELDYSIIQNFYVSTEHQHKGIGTQLLEHALKDLVTRGFTRVIAYCKSTSVPLMYKQGLRLTTISHIPYVIVEGRYTLGDNITEEVANKTDPKAGLDELTWRRSHSELEASNPGLTEYRMYKRFNPVG